MQFLISKETNMFIGLDRDTGRSDFGATPATRADAEQALRDFVSGPSKEPEGLCPECAIELALKEAHSRGLTPESPEFGEIFERIFAEGNPGGEVKVKFLGAVKIGDEMPDELKAKLADAGHPAFSGDLSSFDPLAGYGILKDRPLYDEPVPNLLGDTALTPFRIPVEPTTSTIGGSHHFDEAAFDEALREIFGMPPGKRLPEPQFGGFEHGQTADEDSFDEERRGVVQDLAAAVLNVSEQLHEPGAEAVAEALRDIAALAFETYGG
ncbi:hypothetical protein ADL19_14880 [Streptomyces purpurogeneiscleroticus]|nr:hypothetical protein ADL19_14880 [Streptomyces purpurogeneiscleroticus]